MNILLIEDTTKLAENIATVLRKLLYHVTIAGTLDKASNLFHDHIYDLVILDLSLPDGDGIDLCTQMRNEQYKGAILMLTARVTITSRIEGLDRGADDYLTKPFDMDELLARIRALTRRNSHDKTTEISIGDITINTIQKWVRRGTTILNLSPTEYRLMEYFVAHRGSTQTATDIYESVWGSHGDNSMFSESLKVHLSRLRKKIGDDIIETVQGFGYILK
ncbi:MAG: response regulator transcription factor [Candidatus Roizmanbacteria bacterium]